MADQRMAIEAAAIGAYESFVRYKQYGSKPLQYPDWVALTVAERQSWRYRVVEIVKGEVA